MTRMSRLGGAGALLILTVLVYLPAFRAGFIWDDDLHLTDNLTLRSLDGLGDIWFRPGAILQYYPLVHTTFWIEYHLWGLNPLGYHIVNVLLHAASTLLVWAVFRRLALPWAWLAAAIFALHPVYTESVVWVTERKNTLSGLLYLVSMLAYLRFRPLEHCTAPQSGGNRRYYAAALAAYAGALFSKTVTCSLPAALLLLIWWKRGRIGWRDVWPLVPFFILGLAFATVTVRMETGIVGASGPDWALSFSQRFLIAGRALWFYAYKLAWPVNLAFIYERWHIDARVWWQYFYPAAALGAVLGLWLTRRRIGRGPLTAVLFFAGTVFPALGFFNIYPMRYSFVADHFQYLASLGLVALAVGSFATIVRRLGARAQRAAPVCGAAVLGLLAVSTFRQGVIYENLETLWRDTIAKSPSSWIAANNLGTELDQLQRSAEAVPYLERALQWRPGDNDTLNNLANAYGHVGRLDDALRTYGVTLAQDPNNPKTHYNLGTTLAQAGRDEEAIAHLALALQNRRWAAAARANLQTALLRRSTALLASNGATDAALLLEKTLPSMPECVEARVLLAHALGALGRSPEAIAEYRECLRRQPDLPEALNGLAWHLATSPDAALRNGPEAVTLARRASDLNQRKDPALLDTLAAALAEAARFDEALEVAREARARAVALGDQALLAELDQRIELYAKNTAYHAP